MTAKMRNAALFPGYIMLERLHNGTASAVFDLFALEIGHLPEVNSQIDSSSVIYRFLNRLIHLSDHLSVI